MDKVNLINYLNEKKSARSFSNEIANEISLFKKALSIKGKSVNISLENDYSEFVVNYTHLEKIYQDFINDEIDVYFLSYISDAILLSNHSTFQDEVLMELFESLTDFEDRRMITKEYIKNKILVEIENQQLLFKNGKPPAGASVPP
jgi:hypothetical protein